MSLHRKTFDRNSFEYVDLGLPSGTLWATENAQGYYTFNEAVETFSDSLPVIEEFRELLKECKREWNEKRKGITVTGPNGKSIFFPASGYRYYGDGSLYGIGSRGYCWSASAFGSYSGYYLYFNLRSWDQGNDRRAYGYPVRPVKRKQQINKAMNEKLNLAEILKDCPEGTKLFSPIFGDCQLDRVSESQIIVTLPNTWHRSFWSDGTYIVTGDRDILGVECMLFPSRENRDWSTFKCPNKRQVFQPYAKVIARVNSGNAWYTSTYSHYSENYFCHVLAGGDCVSEENILPFKGNEDKLGKITG